MRCPARCNKCQARRTLSKHHLEYKRDPKCHLPGCTGKMRVDTYRMKNKIKDRNPAGVCYDDCYMYPHSRLSPGCKHREDAVIDKVLEGSDIGFTYEDEFNLSW